MMILGFGFGYYYDRVADAGDDDGGDDDSTFVYNYTISHVLICIKITSVIIIM